MKPLLFSMRIYYYFEQKTIHAYLDRYVIELNIPFEVPFNFVSVEYVNSEAKKDVVSNYVKSL